MAKVIYGVLATNRAMLVRAIKQFAECKQRGEELIAPRPVAGGVTFQHYVAFVKVAEGGRNFTFLKGRKGFQLISKNQFDDEASKIKHAWRA